MEINKCHNCGHDVKQCTGEGLLHYMYDDANEIHMFGNECFTCYCDKAMIVVK